MKLLFLLLLSSTLYAQNDTVKTRLVDLSSQGLKATIEVPDNGSDIVLWKKGSAKKPTTVGVTAGPGFIVSIDIKAKDVLSDEMFTNISFDAYQKVTGADADNYDSHVIFREATSFLVSWQSKSNSKTFYHFERIFSVGKSRYTVTGHNGKIYDLEDCYVQLRAAKTVKILE